MTEAASRQGFARRVAVMFGSHVVAAGLGFVSAFLIARLLGPSGKGDYYLIVLLPTTLMVLLQLGLPQAFGFHAARGRVAGMLGRAVLLTVILSVPAALLAWALMPLLVETLLKGVDPELAQVALLTLPLLLGTTFAAAIVVARGAVAAYSAVTIVNAASGLVLVAILVGALDLGVQGALAVFFVTALVNATGVGLAARRAVRAVGPTGRVSTRALFRYGLPLYPAIFTVYFSYRADVYLLALLLADPAAPIGYYTMAVTLAELVFFLPDAIATNFFPRVASGSKAEADREVPRVARLSLLLTGASALLLAPAATLLVALLLPAFGPALPVLFILLPGVVVLAVNKVLTGYLSGIARPGLTSLLNIAALILNVTCNVAFIPQFGIIGAAVASLISYTASALVFTAVAARMTGRHMLEFLVPRQADFRLIAGVVMTIARRLLGRSTSTGSVS